MTSKNEKELVQDELPSYKNPPINEVVCGLRFKTPERLRIPHIGLLWNKFKSDYPNIQHVPPIASSKGELILDKQVNVPLPRVWFINEEDDQLIQFQLDRFYFNWRRREKNYPRYSNVIKNFKNVFGIMRDFFNEFNLGELKPIEYELTYLNHIPKGDGWETIDDLPNLFLDFKWNRSTTRFLHNPQKITWTAEFALPEQKGTLSVNLKNATRIEDKLPLLVFELSAKLIDESIPLEKIPDWFNLSHEWIVKGFTDLTTPEMQKFWEKV